MRFGIGAGLRQRRQHGEGTPGEIDAQAGRPGIPANEWEADVLSAQDLGWSSGQVPNEPTHALVGEGGYAHGAWGSRGDRIADTPQTPAVEPPFPGYTQPPSPPADFFGWDGRNFGALAPPAATGRVSLIPGAPFVNTGVHTPMWQTPNLVTPQPTPWDEEAFLGLAGSVNVLGAGAAS